MRFLTLLSSAFEDTVSIKKNVFLLLVLYIALQILFFSITKPASKEDFEVYQTIFSMLGLVTLQFFHFLFLYFLRHKKAHLRIGVKAVALLFVRLFVAALLVAVLTALGFVMLIIPGLFVMTFLFLVEPIILFENKTILVAVKESYERTKALLLPIFLSGVFYVLVVFSFAGDNTMTPFWLIINGIGAGFVGLYYAALMQKAYEMTLPQVIAHKEPSKEE